MSFEDEGSRGSWAGKVPDQEVQKGTREDERSQSRHRILVERDRGEDGVEVDDPGMRERV